MGDEDTRSYSSKVYRGSISISDVPNELREKVQIIVNNKIEKFGKYQDQQLSPLELQNMLEEIL